MSRRDRGHETLRTRYLEGADLERVLGRPGPPPFVQREYPHLHLWVVLRPSTFVIQTGPRVAGPGIPRT
jgi:hypothetical protein